MSQLNMSQLKKFRAWDGAYKKMTFWTMNDLCSWGDESEEVPSPFDEWMQCTGLMDINGKEIYEGDIVDLTEWDPQRYEMVFNRGGFCLKLGEESEYSPDCKYAEGGVVIGNIYENPELIK